MALKSEKREGDFCQKSAFSIKGYVPRNENTFRIRAIPEKQMRDEYIVALLKKTNLSVVIFLRWEIKILCHSGGEVYPHDITG